MQTLTVDSTDGRQRPADYINICRNIADSYPAGIVHGIQKDAIQSGLDAVVGKKPLMNTTVLGPADEASLLCSRRKIAG